MEVDAGAVSNVTSGSVNGYLNSTNLLNEVTSNELPSAFQRLLFDNPTTCAADKLVLAVHSLMIECCFTISSTENGSDDVCMVLLRQ